MVTNATKPPRKQTNIVSQLNARSGKTSATKRRPRKQSADKPSGTT